MSAEEEGWRASLVNGTEGGRIPQGESMTELAQRMQDALNACLALPAGSRPLIVSHGMALGVLVSTILGLPAYAERRLRLLNCSISALIINKAPGWQRAGWSKRREIFRILTSPRWTNSSGKLTDHAVIATA